MVSIIPNRSKVVGKILSVKQSKKLEDFSIMELKPTKIQAVKNSANLLDKTSKDILEIYIPHIVCEVQPLHEGMLVSCIIRKAPDNLFVIPDSVKIIE